MSLESATFTSDLVATNPADTDQITQGAAHMRLLKATLQATFPNITGAVTPTHTVLNGLDARTTALETGAGLLAAANTWGASQTITGSLTASTYVSAGSYVDAPAIKQGGNLLIPSGFIGMWTGLTAPAGWKLCDGTSGTPNLTDRFVIGAGNTYTVGAVGGSLGPFTTTSSMAGITVNTAGSHNHTGAVGSYTLQIADIPAHSHGVNWSDPGHAHVTSIEAMQFGSGPSGFVGPGHTDAGWQNFTSSYVGTGISMSIQWTGGGGGHVHGISADGAHYHALTDPTHSHTVTVSLPPYYALAFIQKI